MRYVVLSDIHSNLEALTAVLQAPFAKRLDRVLCLGDILGYGADPAACLTRIHALGAVMVAGNHEWACIGKLDTGWFNDAARVAVTWTRDQLGFVELDILRRLPLTTTEGSFTLVHGSLRQPARFEYLTDLASIIDTLKSCRTLFCLVGHTHVPLFVEYDRQAHQVKRVISQAKELRRVTFEDDPERFRYLLNPGSVGQPRDGSPQASAAVVDLEAKQLSVERVPYPVEQAAGKIRQAGLPAFLAERLAAGR